MKDDAPLCDLCQEGEVSQRCDRCTYRLCINCWLKHMNVPHQQAAMMLGTDTAP